MQQSDVGPNPRPVTSIPARNSGAERAGQADPIARLSVPRATPPTPLRAMRKAVEPAVSSPAPAQSIGRTSPSRSLTDSLTWVTRIQAETTANGTVTKNTQRHERRSVSTPPMAGPARLDPP